MEGFPLPARYAADSPSLHYLEADSAGIIRVCNHAVTSRQRYPADSLIGQPLWPLLTAPDAATVRQWLEAGCEPAERQLLLNFIDADSLLFTLDCALIARPDGFLLVGEPTFTEDAALAVQLLEANADLAMLTRENIRKHRELARALAQLQGEIAAHRAGRCSWRRRARRNWTRCSRVSPTAW